MKKLLLAMALVMWSLSSVALTHTVARGESLQSIAQKYNISVDRLLEANPGAGKLFYVGLKLEIPENVLTAENTPVQQEPAAPAEDNPAQTESQSEPETDPDKPGITITTLVEYGFLSKESGMKGDNYTYAFTVGANYYFMHSGRGVFAGANIGYNSANYNQYQTSRGEYVTSESTSHFITLPVHIGYTFASANNLFGISPYAGIDFNFCVGGKMKMKANAAGQQLNIENKFEKKVGIDARVGAFLRIYGFNVGAAYVIPLNDNQKMYFGKDSYIAISIGYGF